MGRKKIIINALSKIKTAKKSNNELFKNLYIKSYEFNCSSVLFSSFYLLFLLLHYIWMERVYSFCVFTVHFFWTAVFGTHLCVKRESKGCLCGGTIKKL